MLRNKWLQFLLKLAISAGLIWLVLRDIEIADAASRLSILTLIDTILFLLLGFLLMANNAVRWQIVLSAIGCRLGFGITMKFNLIGLFFGQTLPAALGGDAVRVFLCYRHGIDGNRAFNSVMLERIATITGLILLVVAGQPFLLARVGSTGMELLFPLLAIGAIAGILAIMSFDRLPNRILHWRLVSGLAKLAQDTRKLFLSARYGIPSVLLGVTGFAIVAVMTFSIALALNIRISLLDCLVLVPPVMLVTTLPISIAGWGVRETAMIYSLGLVGVSEADALILSILIGVFFLIVSFSGGIIWLAGERHKKNRCCQSNANQSP